MSLFQKSVIQKYLNNLNDSIIQDAYKRFQDFYGDKERIENIKLLKEENYQEGFLREIFVDVLGYTINPDNNYNLTTEFKNLTDSGKADGAILLDGKAIGVIELKSTKTTDLESIKKQAFSYKNNQPDCRYVITSNFEKLRFYIDNATEYEEFKLFKLSPEQFTFLYLILSKESIFSSLPVKLKDESRLHEESVSDKLYKDYSSFKRNVFNNLVKSNPQHDKLFLFHKSQKLLDRLLFVLFAEDRGLIPPNAISKIIDQWEKFAELDEPVSLYSRFVKLFHHLNEGHKYPKYELPAYNGGLFRKDEILDSLIIDDDILHKDTLKLSTYDFNTEIDVNILGHIFEHSINEIEELTAELEGKETSKNKSKRKKEGIFYTPKFITKYIVENTVGALCEEKKKELNIDEIETEIIKNSRTVKGKLTKKAEELLLRLDKYRNYLLSLKILDPACGSGAFLIQALEFLINEHEMIDSYRKELEQDQLGLYDISKSILENNLYGVDINEEAVEIAKLSLWLRTAEKGRRLSNLSNNIKCGNSLIDAPEVAGDKAFNWEKEFPEIMSRGGFDAVIGNPPYVRHELISEYKNYLQKEYRSFQSTADLYVYFIEKGCNLLLRNGILGYITSNKFIQSTYGKKLRAYLGNNYFIKTMINFGELPVFEDAATFPLISIIHNKKNKGNTSYVKVNTLKSLDIEALVAQNSICISPETFEKTEWMLISNEEKNIINSLRSRGKKLKEYLSVEFYRGILTGFNTAFLIDEDLKNTLIGEDPNSEEIIKPFVDGDDVRRYHLRNKNKYLIFTRRGTEIDNYPSIKKYLYQFYDDLLPKQSSKEKRGRKKGDYKWFEIQDTISYFKEFDKPKIIYPEIAKESRFTLDHQNTYLNKTIFFIPSDDKYLLVLLNSKLVWFYLINVCTSLGDPKQGGRLNMQKVYLDTVPIVEANKSLKDQLVESANRQLTNCNAFYNKKVFFLNYLKSKFHLESISKKLQNWNKLEFNDFLKELKKTKVQFSLAEEAEWMQYFNEQKQDAQELQILINKTDYEIDKMVYRLYGLTDEEIKIVEENT